MPKKPSKKCFTKNGRTLRALDTEKLDVFKQIYCASENISTLFDNAIDEKSRKNGFSKLIREVLLVCSGLGNKIDTMFEHLLSSGKNFIFNRVSLKPALVWVSGSTVSFVFLALVVLTNPFVTNAKQDVAYKIYAAKPLTMEQTTFDIYSKDSRSQRINEVFKAYNCPLEGMGEVFVHEADKNNIPWWLVAAVSFQESSCGRRTPKVDSGETYNAWGWAVYGGNVHSFDNWARGIETVSEYFGKKFYSKGVTDTCEIMKTYTPPSNGSWCEGVNYFGDLIQNYRTPEEPKK